MSILLKTFVTNSQITRLSPVQSIFIRNKSRDKKYGSEGIENGFDRGNEVRKERWIKKHMPYKTSGGEYREELGYVMNPNRGSPLYDIPDWRYVDGTPGIPRYCYMTISQSMQCLMTYPFCSLNQVRTMLEEKQYAIQIKEALDLIRESKESVKEHKVKYNARKESYERSKLKHKGKMRLV